MHVTKVEITFVKSSPYGDDRTVVVAVNPRAGVRVEDARLSAEEFLFAAEVLAVAKKYADDFASSDD